MTSRDSWLWDYFYGVERRCCRCERRNATTPNSATAVPRRISASVDEPVWGRFDVPIVVVVTGDVEVVVGGVVVVVVVVVFVPATTRVNDGTKLA